MTYTILARNPDNGQIGIGITTVSTNVGGLVPFYAYDGAIVASQAYAQPKIGALLVRRLYAGQSFSDALQGAQEFDGEDFKYRQVAIIGRSGEILVHTGSNCRAWAGHVRRTDMVVMGNVLRGPDVLGAMAESFVESVGESFGERLLRTLEAGRDAGGQVLSDGTHLRERSAAICIMDTGYQAALDLRVDVHPQAVHELRRIFTAQEAVANYVALRADKPRETPPVVDFEADIEEPSLPSAVG